ncbi:MAG: aminotransferase class I/II-fold pyridoxal phosphate-dependent enzyme, partial [Alphaproteobacteria bacterium]|nr:aminotransferase class I/II-fold pyridoxal phosphate-dependent enzyme [Alphaproteobacteria bacterium]
QSSVPDLRALQLACQEFGAFLLVSVSNDLGCMGEDGAGAISDQAMLGRIDLVLGGFSTALATTGGFLAIRSRAARDHVRHAVRTRLGSIGLAPMQAAAALSALCVAQSTEGRRRRQLLADRAEQLRGALAARGHRAVGNPSPIVLVGGANDEACRIAGALAAARGLRTTLLEPPTVARRQSRLRLQVTTAHSPAQLTGAAGIVADAFTEAAMPGQAEARHHQDRDALDPAGFHASGDRLAFI